jgi:flagellar assembly factor FliW
MSVIESSYFGKIPYQPESVLEFTAGLPGFEQARRFQPVRLQETGPLVFLQSLEDPGLCFVTLPAAVADPAYRLAMTEEDVERIGLPRGSDPAHEGNLLCLVVVTVKEGGPTANLLAPIVANLGNRLAVQAIAPGSDYSWEHVLLPAEAPVCS